MAKFSGKVGYGITAETYPGVWEETITEKSYRGDVLRNTRRWEKGDSVNDNLNINNLISIVADSFALENLGSMKYVEYIGTKWKITNVEIQRPRVILTIGGVYNE